MLDDATKYIKSIKFDHLKIFLILLFTVLYLPHCFVLNEDLGLILAYETDAGTILQAIIGLLDNYNFHDYLHPRAYGWTFFTINYIFLKPIQIFFDVLGYSNSLEFLIFCAKLLFFLIGLLSMIFFNEILLKILKNNFYALLGSLMYVMGNISSSFYMIHPETTGLLFMFLAILSLLNFLENNKNDQKLYYYGLIFLVLSSLSKQIFFFTSLPILGIFIWRIITKEEVGFLGYIKSKDFMILVRNSLLATFITLLIVNPFLIFDFKNAIAYQTELLRHHNETGFRLNLLSNKELIILWFAVIFSMPIALFYFISVMVSYFVTIFKMRDGKKGEGYGLFLVMISSVYVVFILITLCNKLYVLPLYLVPIYPFFIINILLVIRYLNSKNIILSSLLVIFCIISLLASIYVTVVNSKDRYWNYKNSMAFKSYEYILRNFDENDKIIHDHLVAMPSKFDKNTCDYWFNKDCLKKFEPDYIMIVRNFKTNGERSGQLKKILEYVEKNNMKLKKQIKGYRYGDDYKISIYKK